MDRDETLRRAEKLLRQGRLEAAIAEYAALVEDNPRDLAAANALGDLYVRAGQIDQAVAQYTRVAEQFAHDGFVSKATALYKKIVKIRPEDDAALARTAELAANQGLTAEARLHLQALYQQRRRRGDIAGAAKAAAFHAEVDPGDASGRIETARMLAEVGDGRGAATHLRAAGETFRAAGRTEVAVRTWREALRFDPGDDATSGLLVEALLDTGDIDGARDAARSAAQWRSVADGFARAGRHNDAFNALERALAEDPADISARVHLARAAMARDDAERARALLAPVENSDDPVALLALAEVEFRCGAVDRGRAVLQRCLSGPASAARSGIELGCAIGPTSPRLGFAVISTIVQFAEGNGDTDLAIDAIERFLAVAPGDLPALEELVRVCGQSFYENQRYRAQVQLVDSYLASEHWREARPVAEELVAARPDDAGHVQRLSRALAGLGVADARAADAPAAAGRGIARSAPTDTTPLPPAPRFSTDVSLADVAVASTAWAAPSSLPPAAAPAAQEGLLGGGVDVPPAGGAVSRELQQEVKATAAGLEPRDADRDVFEIDLSDALDGLLGRTDAAPGRQPDGGAGQESPRGLEGFFEDLREEHGRGVESTNAALAYDQASEHFNRGEIQAAADCLRTAARDPLLRFRAASMLARIARDNQRISEAIEWLERAAEAPPPSLDASHGLLYELGDTLELGGEHARALAVFIELQSGAPGYRDVGARIAKLSSTQADPGGPRRGRT